MSVEAAAGGGTSTAKSHHQSPDLTSPDAALSTPRVHRARNALDFRTIAADASAVPAWDAISRAPNGC